MMRAFITSHMRPRSAEENDGSDGFDRWIALRKSTDEARANLIADIVGHPKGAPSVAELDYMNPSLGEDAVRNHLRELREADVIEELVVETGKRIRGYPYKFYRITEEARRLFDDNSLFPEDAWRRQYERVEKSTEVKEMETMPRPELSTDKTTDEENDEVDAKAATGTLASAQADTEEPRE